MTTEKNRALIRHLFEDVLNGSKMDVVDEIISAEYSRVLPSKGRRILKGKARILIGHKAIQGTPYPPSRVTNPPVGRRTMWSRPETSVVGEPFLGPPVDLTGVVEGTSPCPSLARVAVADTAETFPPYPLAYRTVRFVRARGAASRRHTGPLIVGQDLGRERACFPMMEIRTT